MQIADRCYVIRNGEVLCEGRPDEVLNNAEAKEHYFGDNSDPGLQGPPPSQMRKGTQSRRRIDR